MTTKNDICNAGGSVYEVEKFGEGYCVVVRDKKGLSHYLPHKSAEIETYETAEDATGWMMAFASLQDPKRPIMTILPDNLDTDEDYELIQWRGIY